MADRIVSWFSCGAASAVATKLAIARNAAGARLPFVVARCYVEEEHADNDRFAAECAVWFGQEITVLRDERFGASIYKVFEKERYIVGIAGAPCTRALKKRVRESFQRLGDLQVFGYTAEEQDRVDRFIDSNNDAHIWAPLVEEGLTHSDCLAMVERAGIELPAMYKLGYHNNNCIGCVKGGAGYWNKVRIDFPAVFDRQAKLQRSIGATTVKQGGERVYLDELRPDTGNYPSEPSIECGIFCEMAEREFTEASHDH